LGLERAEHRFSARPRRSHVVLVAFDEHHRSGDVRRETDGGSREIFLGILELYGIRTLVTQGTF
jgi:hypothetical protein